MKSYQEDFMAGYLGSYYHGPGNGGATLESHHIAAGETYKYKSTRYGIVFITSGVVRFTQKGSTERVIAARHFFMQEPGALLSCEAIEPSHLIIICRMKYSLNSPDLFNFDDMTRYLPQCEEQTSALAYKKPIAEFIKSLETSLKNDLRDEMYLLCKYSELLFLLRKYYSYPELACFFRPILGHDFLLRTFIYNNVDSVESVAELAKRFHLTEVGFRKKFKKEMGVSPREFIMERKKDALYHEIVYGDKPFKVICQEYGINSQSNLNTFCQRCFGISPNALRNLNKKP